MDPRDSAQQRRVTAWKLAAAAVAIIPINALIFFGTKPAHLDGMKKATLCFGLALLQCGLGVGAVIVGRRTKKLAPEIVGSVAFLLGLLGAGLLTFVALLAGTPSGWGRPLRVRGRQTHPTLTEGSDWTFGPQPDASHISEATREALAALWWHDAQKEHASVPAFARISWILAAAGAPSELLVWAHKAGLEEIEHAQNCFALAAGYAGRSRTVEPMPDLMLEGFTSEVDPRVLLAEESLKDGCQMEDFNADVAGACALVCTEPVTKAALEKIAREERSHADFSWAVLDWLLMTHPGVVVPVLAKGIEMVRGLPRPVAVVPDKARLVAEADVAELRSHGRIADTEWAVMWQARLRETERRLRERLDHHSPRIAA